VPGVRVVNTAVAPAAKESVIAGTDGAASGTGASDLEHAGTRVSARMNDRDRRIMRALIDCDRLPGFKQNVRGPRPSLRAVSLFM
jgi:hypothetical protein